MGGGAGECPNPPACTHESACFLPPPPPTPLLLLLLLLLLHVSLLQEELGCLKALWDQVAAVLFIFADWQRAPWGSVDVEALVEECKRLGKEMRTLHKAVCVCVGGVGGWGGGAGGRVHVQARGFSSPPQPPSLLVVLLLLLLLLLLLPLRGRPQP